MSAAVSTLPSEWRIELPIFEGPLDLLLHLVRINEVEITDIPVARVCDQFHEYLGLMEELDLDVAAEYLYEAALLIHLKSKILLPRPPAGAEEAEDPRQELVERLLEYRKLKEAAQSLAEIHSVRQGVLTREAKPVLEPGEAEEEEGSLDLGEVSLFDLLGAFKRVLVRYEHEHPPPLLLRGESYSVRAQFERLLARLDAGHAVDLLEDLGRLSCRAEAVAGFLALLELARLNLVRIHQTEDGDVLLYRTERELALDELEAIPT